MIAARSFLLAVFVAVAAAGVADARVMYGWKQHEARAAKVKPVFSPLVWADEFNGPKGSQPNWTYDTGHWGATNGELQYSTSRPENVALDGLGNLSITARREPYQGLDYTSGRISTRDKFSFRYGRVEARIKVPQGLWSAFWMLGGVAWEWPQVGEIDVMENIGPEPNVAHGTLHGPTVSGGHWQKGNVFNSLLPLAAAYRVYGIAWRQDVIEWTVDGIRYARITRASLNPDQRWVFDHDFHLLLSLSVGGWAGPPGSTVFPATMSVDWVRVYR